MGLDTTRIDAVLVDSYSTLVSVESTRETLAKYVDDPLAVARIWQLRSREYATVGNAVGVYRPASERHRRALEYALDLSDVELEDADIDRILESYHDLEVYDDVRSGLTAIREAGHEIAILSNGDPELLASLVAVTGLEDVVSETISADEIRTYKPERSLYEHAASRIGAPPGNLLHVTTSWSDVNGALNAGLQVAWLNRKNLSWEEYGRDPDLTVDGLDELADAIADE